MSVRLVVDNKERMKALTPPKSDIEVWATDVLNTIETIVKRYANVNPHEIFAYQKRALIRPKPSFEINSLGHEGFFRGMSEFFDFLWGRQEWHDISIKEYMGMYGPLDAPAAKAVTEFRNLLPQSVCLVSILGKEDAVVFMTLQWPEIGLSSIRMPFFVPYRCTHLL